MRVYVRVRDSSIMVDVGPGHQRLKWLAMVALQRYSASMGMQADGGSLPMSHSHVATGLVRARSSLSM
jgi:hypothetical protein